MQRQSNPSGPDERTIIVSAGTVNLEGTLSIPAGASGIVLFAHGSGSSRFSPRNRFVAGVLQEGGIGTLLIDLLTREEEAADAYTGHLRFDIDFLATRLIGATLLIVGGHDFPVIDMNRAALRQLACEKHLEIVPGATHLFEEPGTLEAVAELARAWFGRYLGAAASTRVA
jgi:hypothetical protein